jgi:hypothetical protein
MKPITAVRSWGSTTMEMNAAFGAISIEANEERSRRKNTEADSDEGIGIRQSAMAEGR